MSEYLHVGRLRLPRFRRMAIGLLLVGLFTVSLAAGPLAVVKLKDGRELRGELVGRTDDQLSLKIADIVTPINMNEVEDYEILGTVREIYNERRAKLKDDDLDGRYALAYWLFEHKAYQLSMNELVDLKRRFPDDQKTQLLMTVVQERLKLKDKASDDGQNVDDAEDQESETSSSNGQGGSETLGEVPLLTSEQINLIYVYELPQDFVQQRWPINVPRGLILQVANEYASNPLIPKSREGRQKLRAMPGYDQVDLLFKLRASQYYGKVNVRRAPPTLKTFRQQINPQYVATYFAPIFGQGRVPGLRLIEQDARNEEAAMTNFYILSQFFSGGQAMLDRVEPDNSLLLQWGLERDLATYPAPDIEGWRPRFRSKSDPMYVMIRQWIDDLYNNADYGISYRLPSRESSSDQDGSS